MKSGREPSLLVRMKRHGWIWDGGGFWGCGVRSRDGETRLAKSASVSPDKRLSGPRSRARSAISSAKAAILARISALCSSVNLGGGGNVFAGAGRSPAILRQRAISSPGVGIFVCSPFRQREQAIRTSINSNPPKSST
jgi:hypothetical protein